MATVTKTFSFTSSSESFTATSGPASTLTWDSTTGNPAGALKSRITGRNKSDSNYWEWTGTWEALGVPTGSTVTAIRVNAGYTRCSEYTTGASTTIGPYQLYDNTPTLQATLWSGRTVTGSSASWTAIAAQADQSVPSAIQASNSTIRLRLADSLNTGASNSAAVSTYDDEVSFVITYSTPTTTSRVQDVRITGASGGGGSAAAYVKELSVGNTTTVSTTTAITLSAGSSIGNTAVLMATFRSQSGPSTATVSDAKGNTWSVDVQTYDSTNKEALLMASTRQDVAALASGDTVTITWGANAATNNVAWLVEEFSGLLTASAIDQTGTAVATAVGTTGTVSTSNATTQANEIAVGAFSLNTNGLTATPDASWSQFTTTVSQVAGGPSTTYKSLIAQYDILSATGTASYSPSWNISQVWCAGIVTYKAASSSTSSSSTQDVRITGTTASTSSSSQDVRITGSASGSSTTYYADAFTRTVGTQASPTGWGSADTGGAWTLSDSTKFYVDGTVGRIEMAAAATEYRAQLGVGDANADYTVTGAFTLSGIPSTSNGHNYGILGRVSGTTTFYRAELQYTGTPNVSPGALVLFIYKRVAGADTQIPTGTSVTVSPGNGGVSRTGEKWWIKLDMQGSTIQAKAWQDGTTEPSTYQITTTDTSITNGGVGVRVRADSGDTNLPTNPGIGFDDLSAVNLFTGSVPATPVLDNFNRADGAPGSNWAQAFTTYSVPPIASNQLSMPQFPSAIWNTQFGADQEVYWTDVNTGTGFPVISGILRLANPNSGSESGYTIKATPGGSAEAFVLTAGTGTSVSLGFYSSGLLSTDTHILFRVIGSVLSLYGSSDGTTWNLRRSWTDTTWNRSGYIGVIGGNNTNFPGAIDDFGGGTITSGGPTTSSQVQDVRITGQSSSSIAKDVRLTGQSTSSSTQDVRAVGQSQSSYIQNIRTTGTSSSIQAQDVRVIAQAQSLLSQDVRIVGQNTSNSTTDIRVIGQAQSNSTQNIRVTGQLTSSLMQDVRLLGFTPTTVSQVQNVRVTAQAVSVQLQDVRITGQLSSSAVQDTRVTGQLTSNYVQDVKLTAAVATQSSASVDTRITATATSTRFNDVRVTGQLTSNQVYDLRIVGQASTNRVSDIRITGQLSTSVVTDIRIQGQATSLVVVDSRITGQLTASYAQDVKLTAFVPTQVSQAQDVRVVGTTGANIAQDIRIVGQNTSQVPIDIRIVGQSSSVQVRDVRVTAQNSSNLVVDARVQGQAVNSLLTDARIVAQLASLYLQDGRVVGQASSLIVQNVRLVAQAQTSTVQDVRSVGQITSFSTQDVRLLGFIPTQSSVAIDVRITATDANSYFVNTYIVGQLGSAQVQDVRVTSQAASSYGQGSRITGQLTSIITTAVRLIAQLTSTDTQDVRITAQAINSTTQDVRIQAQNTTSQVQDARVAGKVIVATVQDVRLTADPNSNLYLQEAHVVGQLVAIRVSDVRTSGQIVTPYTQDVRLISQITTAVTLNTFIVGQAIASQAFDTKLTGQITTSNVVDVRLLAATTTQVSLSTDVRLSAQSSTSSAYNVRAIGQLASSTTNDVRIFAQGVAASSHDARLVAQDISTVSYNVRTTGVTGSLYTIDVRLTSETTAIITQDVRITSDLTAAATYDARVTAFAKLDWINDTSIIGSEQTTSAFDVRLSAIGHSEYTQDAFVTGSATATDTYITKLFGVGAASLAVYTAITGISPPIPRPISAFGGLLGLQGTSELVSRLSESRLEATKGSSGVDASPKSGLDSKRADSEVS